MDDQIIQTSEILPLATFARLAGVSKQTAVNLAREGHLPGAVQVGRGRYLVVMAALAKAVEESEGNLLILRR